MENRFHYPIHIVHSILEHRAEFKRNINFKKGKRKVQGVRQSQTAALPRPQEEEETDNLNKHKPNKRTESTKIQA